MRTLGSIDALRSVGLQVSCEARQGMKRVAAAIVYG